ncbi:hypothetical protein SDC9_163347 [bioreactor metagenome]|uniref:Uncharacterized protein n=1 Tax=bioreactor metagenome TaxID=1076179 RepID=A0A645FRH2_9ZZZZ
MGIVWVGSTTNYASRYCSLALPREIFIDDNTYKGIAADTEHWKKETRVKGTKSFTGYLANGYYLTFPDEIDIEPFFSDEVAEADNSFVQRIFDETGERALHLVDEISKKSAELTQKLNAFSKKEQTLNIRETGLADRENNLHSHELQQEFSVKYSVLSKVAENFSKDQIKLSGKNFWVEYIDRLKEINQEFGKGNFEGYQSWRISQIYNAIGLYDEFYHEVCNMAKHGFQIWESEVKQVLEKTYFRTTLKDALNEYISNHINDERSDEYRKLLTLLEGAK